MDESPAPAEAPLLAQMAQVAEQGAGSYRTVRRNSIDWMRAVSAKAEDLAPVRA